MIKIVNAIKDHFDGINRILSENLKDPDACDRLPNMNSSFIDPPERNELLVAIENDDVIGFGWLTASLPFQNKNCWAEAIIVVHPHHRRKGVGSQLLDALAAFAFDHTPLEKIYGKIKLANESSKSLCIKCGFQPIGDIGSNAVGFIMVKTIR